jgi:hypothetical protein
MQIPPIRSGGHALPGFGGSQTILEKAMDIGKY